MSAIADDKNNTADENDDIMENVHRYFATGVGLITTKGSKYGQNVMAAEWTMQVSYEPMLIAIFIHESPTFWNIRESEVFGVNMASDDQADLVNISGGYSATEFNKLDIPRYFKQYAGKHIDVPMIKGCALNAECKVVSSQKIGDHIMIVGKAISATFDDKKLPLIYHRGNYRKLSFGKISSGRRRITVSGSRFNMLKNMAKGRFVLKAACAVIRSNDNKKVLLAILREEKRQKKDGKYLSTPFIAVDRGSSYREGIKQHLDSLGIVAAQVNEISGIKRVIIKNRDDAKGPELRANFVVFDCRLASADKTTTVSSSESLQWRSARKMPKGKVLLAGVLFP